MLQRIAILWLLLLVAAVPARAADVVDATGRTVSVPDHVLHVLPAGPPAAALLVAIAPDLMLGWPHVPDADVLAFLPASLAQLPAVPAVTGSKDSGTQIAAVHPDLILDYGTVDAGYKERAARTQEATGVPTLLLDGDLEKTPATLRLLGAALHREARAEELARLTEGLLVGAGPKSHRRVVFLRGDDGAQVLTPGGANSGLLEYLGWDVLAPPPAPGQRPGGAFRSATVDQVAALDPDLLLVGSEPMRAKIAASPAWLSLRAVREQHAFVVPSSPFGWVEGPPSINRFVGLAWLAAGGPHRDVTPFAAAFYALVYERTPTPTQIATLNDALAPIAR